jgi:hypothetical protein
MAILEKKIPRFFGDKSHLYELQWIFLGSLSGKKFAQKKRKKGGC